MQCKAVEQVDRAQSCFSLILKTSRNLGCTLQFQKKHTCNLILFFPHCRTDTLPALMVHSKTDSIPMRVRGTFSGFHSLVHCPPCFPACQACCMSPRTRKLSSKGKRKSVLQGKDTNPLTLPLLGCTRLVLGAPARPQSLNLPTLALCKGGSDNSCCNLLVLSVHAHQPSLGRTAPIAARRKWQVWLKAVGKTLLHHMCFPLHRLPFQLSCLSLKGTYNLLLNDVL